MAEVTFVFENDKLKEEFMGWFSDGGGEDTFYDAMSCRGVDVDVNYKEYFGSNVIITEPVKGE